MKETLISEHNVNDLIEILNSQDNISNINLANTQMEDSAFKLILSNVKQIKDKTSKCEFDFSRNKLTKSSLVNFTMHLKKNKSKESNYVVDHTFTANFDIDNQNYKNIYTIILVN